MIVFLNTLKAYSMGQAKKQMIEQMEQGYSSVDNCFVCGKCIRDEGLQKFIRLRRKPGSCSFCYRAVSVCLIERCDFPYSAKSCTWNGGIHPTKACLTRRVKAGGRARYTTSVNS